MKFSLSWLREHLETDATLDMILDTLNSIGLEVEGVENPADSLAPFTVAEVMETEKHPDADKLNVCKVNTGKEIVQIVCGAPNARAGIKVVLGQPGDYVPGIDVTLKAATIRGVDSAGMMCSASELNLGTDHDGIIELPTDAPVGARYVDFAKLDDPVIEVAILPSQQDRLGVDGIARDLAATGIGTIIDRTPAPVKGDGPCPVSVTLETEECPMFVGRLVKGIKNGPSPQWLQDRLTSIGLRSISTLVDITNYVTFDRGRPLHVYDAGKLSGNIVAREGVEGESFEALDDKSYTLKGGETVIADDSGVLGFGGVIGGTSTGCLENTVDVFVEAAWFEPISTAMTGRKHGIESDARYRFERGVDPEAVISGMEFATQLIIDLCGGEASDIIVAGKAPTLDKVISFRPERMMTLGGLDLPAAESIAILERLGFTVTGDAPYSVTPPSWRRDVEGEADLVEEVLRIYGLDNVPSVPLPATVHRAGDTLTETGRRSRAAKRQLAASGLMEAITWSFMRDDLATLFGGGGDDLIVDNPISSALNCMRPSILPNLIEASGRNNDRGANGVAIFEVGPQYRNASETGQDWVAVGIRSGKFNDRHWDEPQRDVTVYDAKADAIAALTALGAPAANLQVFEEAPNWYHPGRSGTLRLGPKNILAAFGEIHPSILKTMDVDGPIVGFEVFVDAAPKPKKKGASRGALNVSNLQSVERDFAFVVARDTKATDLVKAVKSADKKLIAAVTIFDVYEGEHMDADKKSVALSVTLTPRNATFSDKEIEAVSSAVIAAAERAVGAVLRG